MRKTFSILALALMTLGFVSCEAETTVEETDALYFLHTDATDDDIQEDDRNGTDDDIKVDDREGTDDDYRVEEDRGE